MRSFFRKYTSLPREIHILFIARIVASVGSFVFPLMTLILTDKLGMMEADAGSYITVLTLIQGGAMIIGGRLADKIGRKKLIVACDIAGSLAYIMCGLLPLSDTTVTLIIIASALFAMTHPAMDALTMDLTTPENRKEAFGLLYMGFNLGFAIGPMIAGFLINSYLPIVFIGDGVTTILSVVLLILFIKETLPGNADGTAATVLERHEQGSVFGVLWRRKYLVLFAIALFLYEFSYMQWSFALPLQMQKLFNDPSLYGIVASFNGLLVIVLTPIVTYVSQKWKPLIGVALSGLLYAIAFAMLIFLHDLAYFFVFALILTAGEVFCAIDSRIYIANHTPASHRARVSSAINIISGFGRVLSPLMIGHIIATGGMAPAWMVIAAVAILGLVMVMGLIGSDKHIKQVDEPVAEEVAE